MPVSEPKPLCLWMCKIQHKQQGGQEHPEFSPLQVDHFHSHQTMASFIPYISQSISVQIFSMMLFSIVIWCVFKGTLYITALGCYQDGLKGTLWKHISAGLLSIYRSPSLGDLYVLMRIYLFLEQFGRSHVSAALPPSIVKVWPGKDHVECSRVLKSKVGLHENLTI